MGLFSLLRKNKQEPAAEDGEFYSRAEDTTKPVRGRRARAEGNAEAALPERKRARRRLIGALALVLAAVIGLPMILDSEPQSVRSDIAIEIPSKEKSELPSVRRTAPPAYPTPGMSAEESSAPASAETQPAPPAIAGKSETASPSAEKPKESSAKPQPAVAAPESKASTPAAKKTDEAHAPAALDGKSAEKPTEKNSAAKSGESFVVQVAALSGKAKVAELRAKLKHAGIQSYTQNVATDSGERIRVRVGPFGSKEEADKMLRRLSKLGLKSAAVVPGNH